MRSCRPLLFRKRQFEPAIIVTCVRWYCRFSLSLRDLEELMAERGLGVDHTTIWRWVQRGTGGPLAATGECEAKIFHLAHG
jgi:transposase-like protein